jgi:Tol biopolymer transport system component
MAIMQTMIMRILLLCVPVAAFSVCAAAQIPDHDAGTLASPMSTRAGIVCTNSLCSAIYVSREGELREIIRGPGVGYGFTVSPDGSLLGLKCIDDDGLQAPAVLDPASGVLHRLHEPVQRAGQVSFSGNGRIAYTIGNELLVTDGNAVQRYDLGTYVNQAPISPDGSAVAYNDADDQIHIRTLRTGEDVTVTDGSQGYHSPQWSPDGRKLLVSIFGGRWVVSDVSLQRTYSPVSGKHPSWYPDSRHAVFERDSIIEGTRLVGADLFIAGYTGGNAIQVTTTSDLLEMDPSVAPDGSILYHTCGLRDIRAVRLSDGVLAVRPLASLPAPIAIVPAPAPRGGTSVTQLNIPYVHQVYDTPDWFNGHSACAPTQAIMVIGYYGLLPGWVISCAEPFGHPSALGNYVADKYRFGGKEFSAAAAAGDTYGAGGYGFMWSTGSPHTRMADYFRAHGMTATQTEGTPHSTALAEVTAGYPFSMCVGLTSAYHLVVAHGVGDEPHTLIFNDPYGDKNRGYMNYYGKNVRYDWPGYNNGYQNLTDVAWCIATRASVAAHADTLVDDLQFARGFTMRNAPPSSMWYYKDLLRGINNHMWYTTTKAGDMDTCSVTWVPVLPQDGIYEVLAYIPVSKATAAPYYVNHATGTQKVVINQRSFSEAWASLGEYAFLASGGASVSLGDAGSIPGQDIVFDAVRWSYRGPLATVASRDRVPSGLTLEPNFPNPFNPTTSIGYSVGVDSRGSLVAAMVRLAVYDMLGREVAVLVDERKTPGFYATTWDALGLASGMYVCRLSAGNSAVSRMMMLMK